MIKRSTRRLRPRIRGIRLGCSGGLVLLLGLGWLLSPVPGLAGIPAGPSEGRRGSAVTVEDNSLSDQFEKRGGDGVLNLSPRLGFNITSRISHEKVGNINK
jgi:hypothetical protein